MCTVYHEEKQIEGIEEGVQAMYKDMRVCMLF